MRPALAALDRLCWALAIALPFAVGALLRSLHL